MRWLLVGKGVSWLIHGLRDELLNAFKSRAKRDNRLLLFVDHEAHVFDELLQIGVADLDFGQALFVHASKRSRNERSRLA